MSTASREFTQTSEPLNWEEIGKIAKAGEPVVKNVAGLRLDEVADGPLRDVWDHYSSYAAAVSPSGYLGYRFVIG